MDLALLIRPDGYVAWAADGFEDTGLTGALQRWFGAEDAGAVDRLI
nr:hypothetical protein [Mycobacterium sp. 155]